MSDCQDLEFSRKVSQKRIQKAKAVLGETVVKRILSFALFLLGAKVSHIAEALEQPIETLRSVNRRVFGSGIGAFADRRNLGDGLPQAVIVDAEANTNQALIIKLSDSEEKEIHGGRIVIPQNNPLQRKVLLLSMIGNDMLSISEVASALKLSESRVRSLHKELFSSDIEAVLDKRRGQAQDYRVDSEMKGRIVAEFILNLAESGTSSSKEVARRLEAEYDEVIAERTIRHHLKRMGLTSVKGYLSTNLKEYKKNSGR